MGQLIDWDDDVVILNGDFMNPFDWNWSPIWTFAIFHAVLGQAFPINNPLWQNGLQTVIGNVYRVTFELANVAFADPAHGIQVSVSSDYDAEIFKTPGPHSVDIMATDGTHEIRFVHDPYTLGDSCDLDNVTIEALGSLLIVQTGIQWLVPQYQDRIDAVAANHCYTIASRTDHTNCMILLNTT